MAGTGVVAEPLLVAIQGELGSNSELAAREYFDDAIDILPCRTFADLFAAVDAGRATAALAPVENALAGSIHQVWELLVARPVPVRGEISLRVVHCLVGLPGATLSDIRRVRSHPQAIAQCTAFLADLRGVAVEEVYDTAGAVAMIKADGRNQEAAIAPAQAAADHGMQVLVEDLAAGVDNFTRFLVLGRGEEDASAPGPGDGLETTAVLKTTVVLELEDTAAALPAVLGLLGDAGAEMLKVETRKRHGRPWAYGAYLEFTGAVEGAVAAALERIGRLAGGLCVVGTYPAGGTAKPRLHAR